LIVVRAEPLAPALEVWMPSAAPFEAITYSLEARMLAPLTSSYESVFSEKYTDRVEVELFRRFRPW